MNKNLEDKINILFVKNVGHLLKNNNIRYIIFKYDNLLEVQFLPIFYNGYLVNLYNNLAYDYDELSDELKEKYKYDYKTLIKRSDFYEYDVKKYVKK